MVWGDAFFSTDRLPLCGYGLMCRNFSTDRLPRCGYDLGYRVISTDWLMLCGLVYCHFSMQFIQLFCNFLFRSTFSQLHSSDLPVEWMKCTARKPHRGDLCLAQVPCTMGFHPFYLATSINCCNNVSLETFSIASVAKYFFATSSNVALNDQHHTNKHFVNPFFPALGFGISLFLRSYTNHKKRRA
jgi:hypothetical protein